MRFLPSSVELGINCILLCASVSFESPSRLGDSDMRSLCHVITRTVKLRCDELANDVFSFLVIPVNDSA